MYKLLILIWLWMLGGSDQVKNNQLNRDTNSDRIYIVNEKTVFANSADSYFENHGFLPQSDSVKSCTECHSDYLENEVVHAPAKKNCEFCHISTGVEHPLDKIVGFTLQKDVPGLCYECHDPKNEEEFVHIPTQEGKCLTCHDVHNSPNLYLVKSDPVSKLCFNCHDLNIPKNNMVHGAVLDGDCQACHNPHQADNEIFLASSLLDRLCRKCHKSIRRELKKEHLHDPFKQKDCFSCHNGHSSKEAHLSDLKTQDLCFSCHEDIHNTIKNASLVHGAINERESCLNCHAPHSSTEKNILKTKENDMCLSCHDKAISTVSGNIGAIGPHLKEGNTIHGAIEMDGCTVCHQPHASEEHMLLTKAFPAEKYVRATADNFSLCFACHDKELIETPTTETVTNFRNGDQNLHYVHIQGERGRNCVLCHDVHGTENKHMIKKKTQFGNWQMPIEFDLTKNGGSCLTGCHARRSYKRVVLQDSLKLKD